MSEKISIFKRQQYPLVCQNKSFFCSNNLFICEIIKSFHFLLCLRFYLLQPQESEKFDTKKSVELLMSTLFPQQALRNAFTTESTMNISNSTPLIDAESLLCSSFRCNECFEDSLRRRMKHNASFIKRFCKDYAKPSLIGLILPKAKL